MIEMILGILGAILVQVLEGAFLEVLVTFL